MDARERNALVVCAAVAAFVAAFVVGLWIFHAYLDDEDDQLLGTAPVGLAEGQYQGVCAVVTPPEPDPCDAVNGTLRYGALYAFESAAYHPKWVAANPGEVQRLAAIMATPACSTPSNPQPTVMRTQYGQGLALVMSAIACARHPEAIAWPPLPPAPNPARTDKTPPTAPGPITVTPSG
jgi:hypothetical protein